ncbi:MAG: cytochrome c maturation protein CcmE [bacterium]
MNRQLQFIIGGVIIAAILGTVVYQGTESTVFFYTPNEILAEPASFQGKEIRIGGRVVPNSTQWNPAKVLLSFRVTENDKTFIPVVFQGPKPDLFREGQGVVVEGRMEKGGVFRASNLLVKHSEEYKIDPSKVKDREATYRTLVK